MGNMPPLQIHCTASGTKLLAPMTEAAACTKFVAAYAKARGTKAFAADSRPTDGLDIELRFLPHGVAMAIVTQMRRSSPSSPVTFNLAVSDRPFNAEDIDQLAANTAAGLKA